MAGTWQEAVDHLDDRTKKTTDAQAALASKLGIDLNAEEPAIVSASRLRESMYDALYEDVRPTTYSQLDLLDFLSDGLGIERPEPDTYGESSAWITWLIDRQTRAALLDLQPEPGDLVRTDFGNPRLVSSVSRDGHVNFRGSGGKGTNPSRLRMEAKASETGELADALRVTAENDIALKRGSLVFSIAAQKELAEFNVSRNPDPAEIELLREAIETAETEKPVQAVLAKYPSLLRAIDPSGHETFVVAEPQLGGTFIPDFVVASIDSAGFNWHFVELESPRKDMGMQDGQFADKARQGIRQIEDWREWVRLNLANAQRSRREGGVGLTGVRAEAPGLVIIGRRDSTKLARDSVRSQLSRDRAIRIQTYDWLLEAVEGRIHPWFYKYPEPEDTHPFELSQGSEIF